MWSNTIDDTFRKTGMGKGIWTFKNTKTKEKALYQIKTLEN